MPFLKFCCYRQVIVHLGNDVMLLCYSPRVSFCGYSIPHPSEARVNIRVQTTGTHRIVFCWFCQLLESVIWPSLEFSFINFLDVVGMDGVRFVLYHFDRVNLH